jgi:hypothetical protein
MISLSSVSGGFSMSCFSISKITAITALIVLAAVLPTGLADAQQGFALVGTWQQVQKDSVTTLVFRPDGTYQGTTDVAPGAGGSGSGRAQWRGTYRPTGTSSYIVQIQFFQMCASGGGCSSCPPSRGELPGSNGCALAQYMGLAPGVQPERSCKMQGYNQCSDAGGQWRRIR